jgi:uncharacterized membrane protein YfcA
MEILEISTVMFLATAFRTALGFGEALVAVPLLSLLLPVKVSAPMAVLASILIALFSVIRDWKHFHFETAKRLLIGTVAGLPIGLLLLHYAPEEVTKGLLGLFLLAFSIFSLAKPEAFTLKDDRIVWLFGFLAGITGGSYGMNGPPLAIYGAGRKWSPSQFRATVQAYFLPASLLGMAGYFFAGIWATQVNVIFAESLPAIAAGIFAGRLLRRLTDKKHFARFLYGGLIFIACLLLGLSFLNRHKAG